MRTWIPEIDILGYTANKWLYQTGPGRGRIHWTQCKDISLREVKAGLSDKQELVRHQRWVTAPLEPEGSWSGRSEARDGWELDHGGGPRVTEGHNHCQDQPPSKEGAEKKYMISFFSYFSIPPTSSMGQTHPEPRWCTLKKSAPGHRAGQRRRSKDKWSVTSIAVELDFEPWALKSPCPWLWFLQAETSLHHAASLTLAQALSETEALAWLSYLLI